MIRLVSAFLALALSPYLANAQGWPAERPIRLIVPFQAGSSSDSIARVVAQRLSERLGQQIIIDNRVGASSMLGTEAIARAAPDGYTIGLANTTTHASAPALTPNLSYDPIKDFSPVGMIGSAPFVLLGAPKLEASNVAEVIALARTWGGATGLSMLAELATQLRGEAGPRQVKGAEVALAENGGGVIGMEEAVASVVILQKV